MALIYCSCNKPASKYQEEKYGKGVRVGCPKNKNSTKDFQQFSCTVCGSLTTKEVR